MCLLLLLLCCELSMSNEQVGRALNYDEVVVYNNEAAMPAYMIVYSLPC